MAEKPVEPKAAAERETALDSDEEREEGGERKGVVGEEKRAFLVQIDDLSSYMGVHHEGTLSEGGKSTVKHSNIVIMIPIIMMMRQLGLS